MFKMSPEQISKTMTHEYLALNQNVSLGTGTYYTPNRNN